MTAVKLKLVYFGNYARQITHGLEKVIGLDKIYIFITAAVKVKPRISRNNIPTV